MNKCPYRSCENLLKLGKENPHVQFLHSEGNSADETNSQGHALSNNGPRKRKKKCSRSRNENKTHPEKGTIKSESISSIDKSASMPSSDSSEIRKTKKSNDSNRSSSSGISNSDSNAKRTRRKSRRDSQHNLRRGSAKSFCSCESDHNMKRKRRKKKKKGSMSRSRSGGGEGSLYRSRSRESKELKEKKKPRKGKKRKKRRKCCSCCEKSRSRFACCCVRCCLACCCIPRKKRAPLVTCTTSCQTPSSLPSTNCPQCSRRKRQSRARERLERRSRSASDISTGSKHYLDRSRSSKRKRKNRNTSSGSEGVCNPPRRARKSRSICRPPKEVTGDGLPREVKECEGKRSCCCKSRRKTAPRRGKEVSPGRATGARALSSKPPGTNCFERDEAQSRARRRPCVRRVSSSDSEPQERKLSARGGARTPCGACERRPDKLDASRRPISGRPTPRHRRRIYQRPASKFRDRAKSSRRNLLCRETACCVDEFKRTPMSQQSSAKLDAFIKCLLPSSINCPGCPRKRS